MALSNALYLLFKDGEVLRWLGSPDKWERIGNDGRIVSIAADGNALYLLFKDGEVLRWLGSPDKWERIGNDGRIVSMAADGNALYLLFKDGEVLRWLGSPDKWERIGNDGRIVSMAAASGLLPQVKFVCRFLDPPGSPTLGPKSYGLKRDGARKSQLQWSVNGVPRGLTDAQTAEILTEAFAVWTAPGVAPTLSTAKIPHGGDIAIGLSHLDAPLLGQTARDGSTIDFNSEVTFAPELPSTPSLLAVAAHEIGHALGLLHSTNPESIMYPVNLDTETLCPEDIAAIRALYSWTPPISIPGVGTDSSPALCACGSTLVMAWRGIGEDDNIWTARSSDGVTWTPQHVVPGAASADGPTLAWDGSQLWLGLRGIPEDDGLYWATSSNFGDSWSGVMAIPDTGSSHGPSMTIFNGAPLLVWRGIPGDDGLYFATWNNPWSRQSLIPGTGSADRPAVCVDFAGLPRMVWRGIPGDDNLYTTSQTGGAGGVGFWQPQQLVQWVEVGAAGTTEIGTPASSTGPSVAMSGGKVFLVWQGIPGDDRIFYTQAAPGPGGAPSIEWSTQAPVPGAATSHRPAIAVMGGRVFLVWKGIPGDHGIYRTSQ